MKKGVVILSEVVAITVFRVAYWWRKSSVLPKGSKVRRIRNRPVIRLPFLKHPKRRSRKQVGIWLPRRT